jgi:hypothetical protein
MSAKRWKLARKVVRVMNLPVGKRQKVYLALGRKCTPEELQEKMRQFAE